MYLSYDADATGVTNLMTVVLSNTNMLQNITSTVIADSASFSDAGLLAAFQSMTISFYRAGDVTTRSLVQYFPDWIEAKTCINNGWQPLYVRKKS